LSAWLLNENKKYERKEELFFSLFSSPFFFVHTIELKSQ
jgi:hypothetical protein